MNISLGMARLDARIFATAISGCMVLSCQSEEMTSAPPIVFDSLLDIPLDILTNDLGVVYYHGLSRAGEAPAVI